MNHLQTNEIILLFGVPIPILIPVSVHCISTVEIRRVCISVWLHMRQYMQSHVQPSCAPNLQRLNSPCGITVSNMAKTRGRNPWGKLTDEEPVSPFSARMFGR